MEKKLYEKVPKMVNGHFKIQAIDINTNKVIYEYEDDNKVVVWVHKYFADAVFGFNPPDIDKFRIHAFALGTDGEDETNSKLREIADDQTQLYSEYNFWNAKYYPPENSYVYQVTFDKPASETFEYVNKLNEGPTWPHIYGEPKSYRGEPKNYEDELEAGMSVKRGFSNGVLSTEIYIGKLAGNGHPAWDNPVKYSEAAFYMTDGATEDGRSLGTLFSMKTFPGLPKSDQCVIKINWALDFNIS
jgi:hypothetical protein